MYTLDSTDNAILEILRKDGRATFSEIAEQVHLSRVSVRERINNLKEQGIILGFTAIIDAKAMQKYAGIYIDLEVNPPDIHKVAHELMKIPEVAIVAQHTGTAGLHVHAYIDSSAHISKFMEEKIYSIPGVKGAEIQILIHQYKTTSYIARYQE